MTTYIIRLDDICPTMKPEPFQAVMAACRQAGVTGILGVIPDNKDVSLQPHAADPSFWKRIKELASAGWIIAQHGYQHVYETKASGILGLRSRSEFAGLPYDIQYRKLAAGQQLLQQQLEQAVTWWMAPAHSFDETTCEVLVDLGFTHITDGIAVYPFKKHRLIWVPHQLWQPAVQPFGVWTIGLHLNTLSPSRLQDTVDFIRRHAKNMKSKDWQPQRQVFNPLFQAYWYAKFSALKHLA